VLPHIPGLAGRDLPELHATRVLGRSEELAFWGERQVCDGGPLLLERADQFAVPPVPEVDAAPAVADRDEPAVRRVGALALPLVGLRFDLFPASPQVP